MHRPLRIGLRVLASVLQGLFCLPTLGFGGYLFVCWYRIHTSKVYYSDYPYATSALIWLGLGFLSAWATLRGVWPRAFRGTLLVLPIFLGLVAMEMIPDILPRANGTTADSNYFSAVNSILRVWYEDNHRFPANEAEYRDALEKDPAAWQFRVGSAPTSRYKQRGKLLPYEVVVMTNADGPRMVDLSQRPGVVYYCVSKDLQEFWVTMTGLESDIAASAYIARMAGLPNEKVRLAHAAGRDYPVKTP
jgi:hypothetical protein